MAGRRAARRRARGGEGIQTLRASRPRLALAGTAACLYLGVAVYAASREPTLAPELGALTGIGAVLLAFVLVRGVEDLLGWALALAGGAYTVGLIVHGSGIDAAAPLVGCGLLLCAELATWSLDARWRVRADPGLVQARALAIAALVLAGLAASGLVIALGATSLGSGLAWTMLGCAAVVGVVALAARLAARA